MNRRIQSLGIKEHEEIYQVLIKHNVKTDSRNGNIVFDYGVLPTRAQKEIKAIIESTDKTKVGRPNRYIRLSRIFYRLSTRSRNGGLRSKRETLLSTQATPEYDNEEIGGEEIEDDVRDDDTDEPDDEDGDGISIHSTNSEDISEDNSDEIEETNADTRHTPSDSETDGFETGLTDRYLDMTRSFCLLSLEERLLLVQNPLLEAKILAKKIELVSPEALDSEWDF